MNKEQQHPQYKVDREIVDRLLKGQPDDSNLTDLARLRIRYSNFPGGRDIQEDLEKVLEKWGKNEEELYEATRRIHARGQAYKTRSSDAEDWA